MSRNSEKRRASQSARVKRFIDSLGLDGSKDKEGLAGLSDLAQGLIAEFGGWRKICKVLVDEFKAAKPGTQTRQRLLDVILRIINGAAKEAGPGDTNTDELDTEDLDALILGLARKLEVEWDDEGEEPDDEEAQNADDDSDG